MFLQVLLGAGVAVALTVVSWLAMRARRATRPSSPVPALLGALAASTIVAMVEIGASVAGGAGSAAVLADLVHNVLEAAGLLALIAAFGLGLRSFEHTAERWVRVAMVVGGLAAIGYSGWDLWHGQPDHAGGLTLVVGAVALVGNSIPAVLVHRSSREHGGRALRLQATDLCLDALKGVAVLAGVVGGKLGIEWIDGVAGIIIGALTALIAVFDRHEHAPLPVDALPTADDLAGLLADTHRLLAEARSAIAYRLSPGDFSWDPGEQGWLHDAWLFDAVTFAAPPGAFHGLNWDVTCVLPARQAVVWGGGETWMDRTSFSVADGRAQLRCRERPEWALPLGFRPDEEFWTSVGGSHSHEEAPITREQQ